MASFGKFDSKETLKKLFVHSIVHRCANLSANIFFSPLEILLSLKMLQFGGMLFIEMTLDGHRAEPLIATSSIIEDSNVKSRPTRSSVHLHLIS